jgi:Ca2+/H+ antiporter
MFAKLLITCVPVAIAVAVHAAGFALVLRSLTKSRAGEYTLVKASVAGAIVTNTLFMLGASFLLGGLRYHV